MKLTPQRRKEIASATIIHTLGLILVFSGLIVVASYAAQPAWWLSRGAVMPIQVTTNDGVVTTNYLTNDYAVINQGQLKQFTARAVDELNAGLSGGAGTNLNNLLSNWVADYTTNGYSATNLEPSDYDAMTVGQLKYVGYKVWSQLVATGYTNAVPSWLVTNSADTQLANLGQLKEVFSFNLDTDTNGLPDWWEMEYFGHLGNNPTNDIDGNGLTLLQDYQQGNNPTNYYSLGGSIITPTIAIVSGNNQTPATSGFTALPLVVQVKNALGAALTNAPVTFSIASGSDGYLSTTSGGSTSTSLSLTTDSSGDASVYYKAGTETFQNNTITATAGSSGETASVNFTAYCGMQSGLTLWLRADAGVTTSGSNVTGWTDQSSSGNNATQTNSSLQPILQSTGLSGKPCLQFSGNNYLVINDSASLRPASYTILAVAKENSSTQTYQTLLCRGYNTSGWSPPYVSWDVDLFGVNLTNYLRSAVTTGTTVHEADQTNFYDTTQPHQFSWVYDESNQYGYVAGSQLFSVSTTGALGYGSGTSDICIGSRSNASPGEYLIGDISEILFFNGVLTTAERQQAEGYLADKYGLYNTNATWPSAYISAVQSEITRNQWNKSQANAYAAFLATYPVVPPTGLVAWLRADTIAQTNNGPVSEWNDQSPAGNNASQSTGTNQPTLLTNGINGMPTVSFNGSKYLSIPDNASLRPPSGVTMIAVYQQNNTSTHEKLIAKPYLSTGWSSANDSYMLDTAQDSITNAPNVAVNFTSEWGPGASAPSAIAQSTPTILSGEYNGTNVNLYVNGSVTAGTALTGGTIDYDYGGDDGQKNVFIGVRSNPGSGEWFDGYASEILIYNRGLTDAERAQAEAYLSQKYNIALPTLVISPNGGSFSSSTTVSISTALAAATIYYTLDGTAPTVNSTQYTGSFTLTQSAPVTCAAFLNGAQIGAAVTAQFYISDSGHIGISDAWQTTYFGHTGIDPNAQSPGGSGLTNLQAYLYGYNPNLYSTNGDGLSDLVNYQLGIAGSDTAISSDGLSNAQNLALGIDPFNTNEAPITPPATNSSDHTAPVINLNQPANATLLP